MTEATLPPVSEGPSQCLLVCIQWMGDGRREFTRTQKASLLLGSGWLSQDSRSRE